MAAFPWVFWCLGTCLLTINIYAGHPVCAKRSPSPSFSVSSLVPWKGVGHFKPKVKGNAVNSENHSAASGHFLRPIKPRSRRAAWGPPSLKPRSRTAAWGPLSLPLLPPSNPSSSLLAPGMGKVSGSRLAALLEGFHGHPLLLAESLCCSTAAWAGQPLPALLPPTAL